MPSTSSDPCSPVVIRSSAMSMIALYINRAGKQLPAPQKRTIEAVKDGLRRICGKKAAPPSTSRRKR